MNIYTKTGDQGTTGNLKGQRIMKSDIVLYLQGDVDEVNAHIGFLRALIKEDGLEEKVDQPLKHIQKQLFKIGVFIAMGFTDSKMIDSEIKTLEIGIDEMTEASGVLKNFIYYNGVKSANYCQVVRSVVRRAERQFVAVLNERQWQEAYPLEYQYMNRLSDYCYTLSRYINHLKGVDDEIMTLN